MAAIIDYRGKTPRKSASGIPLITARIVKAGRIEPPTEFVDPSEYDAWMRRGHPRVGDVVVTTEAPLGEIAQLTDERVALAQRLILLRGKPGVLDNTYLKYLMMSSDIQSQLHGRASGTTVVGIKQSELRNIVLHLPAFNEQRDIAGVLGSLDEKIEQNRRTITALERVARALFRAWFVDFEPIKAKARGAVEFPAMAQHTFDELPTRFIDSEIGLIPVGWRLEAIGNAVEVKGGGTPSTKVIEYWEGGQHHWVTPKDLSRLSQPVLLDTERRITDAGVEQISSGLLPIGSVLLSSRAPVGYLAIAFVPTAINQGFIGMICDGPLPSVYVYSWAQHVMDEIKSRASGTTFPEISKGVFRQIRVLVPSSEILQAFAEIVNPSFSLIATL